MAGGRLAEELSQAGATARYEITFLGDEPHGDYNRILLSGVLAGQNDPGDIVIHSPSWYAESGIVLRAGVRATKIDRRNKLVRCDSGPDIPYDKLVLATGSRPVVPKIAGAERAGGGLKDGVFVFRTLDDCRAILERAGRARRAVVIGGGLLGLEAARGLHARGLAVEVVHLAPHLMETQLDAMAGAVLHRTLSRMGLAVHLGKRTEAILGEPSAAGVRVGDGGEIACDMVVISAGVRPAAELAADAGLTVDRAIVVGDDLASPDDPDVLAIGECAQHRGRVYGFVLPLWEQARVLGARLSGARSGALYEGSRVWTKLKVMGVSLVVFGDGPAVEEGDEVVSYAEPARGVYQKLVIREGRIASGILLGDTSRAPEIVQMFERGLAPPDARAELFFPWLGETRPRSITDQPDDTRVCDCNGVSKGQILAAARLGARSVEEIGAATRAGTGCGSCKKSLAALVAIATSS
jgi:nitrite reductase (NADH) large subunit